MSNSDSLDWKDPTPQQMVDRIKNNLKNGSIILMHNGAKNTPEALLRKSDKLLYAVAVLCNNFLRYAVEIAFNMV